MTKSNKNPKKQNFTLRLKMICESFIRYNIELSLKRAHKVLFIRYGFGIWSYCFVMTIMNNDNEEPVNV